MKAVLCPEYSTVTEQPGQSASRPQIEMIRARYGWAATQVRGKRVLEVGCGAGLGLGVLAVAARQVEAVDVDETNVRLARNASFDLPNVHVERAAAGHLPYQARSFDVVLLLEALYYLPDARRFFSDAARLLAPGGRLLITTVNCQWSGFNPSPFHTRYLSAGELQEEIASSGFEVRVHAAFPEQPGRGTDLRGAIRRLAVKAHLVPRTMRGKRLLKRIFYGRLDRLPQRLKPDGLGPPRLEPAGGKITAERLSRYRVLYVEAIKPAL
jgi:SAM-dependent methyltransferase